MGLFSKKGFRAFRGKDANKFYMFKNDARRKSFMSVDGILKFFYKSAFTAFWILIAGIALGFIIWLMSFIFTLGLITLSVPFEKNIGIRIMNFCIQWVFVALIIYAVVYIVKFIIEWIFILKEGHELKKAPEENQNYLAVAKAIKRVKLFSLISTLIIFASMTILYFSFDLKSSDPFNAISITCLVLLVVCVISNKIYSTRQFFLVGGEIDKIRVERRELKEEKKAEKRLQKTSNKAASRIIFCSFCGGEISAEQQKCPNCNANIDNSSKEEKEV